jgi:cysteine desulfurase
MSEARRIYLDHAASSPLRPEAAAAMQEAASLCGNPSSTHYDGRRAAQLLEQCHDRVAAVLACKHDDVVFNSGGSEGDAHALLGAAELINTVRNGGRHPGVAGKPLRIAVSAIEHKAVLHTAEKLAASGHLVEQVPVGRNGIVDLNWLGQRLRSPGLDLVSLMLVNNETGVIQPVLDAAEACAAKGVVLHCDAVQAPGHGFSAILRNPTIPILTLTGHKFGGPRGTGVLIQRRARVAEVLDLSAQVGLPALICGGHQEHGCRAGTENIAGIAGLTVTMEITELDPDAAIYYRSLQEKLEHAVLRLDLSEMVVHGASAARSPHISSIAIQGHLGRALQEHLDLCGISVGLGSACTSCDRQVSHVLKAMQVPNELAQATLRFSFGHNSAPMEVISAVEALAGGLSCC